MDDPSSILYVSNLRAHAGPLAGIVVCFLVLIFSSLCEAALMRMEPGRAKQLAEESRQRGSSGRHGPARRGARRLVELLDKRQEVLSSLILLINLSIIVASAYATEVTIGLSGGSKRWLPATSLGMITFILTFCEVTPKTYALRRLEAVALATAPVLNLVHKLVHPIAKLLHLLAMWLIRRLVVPLIGGEVLAGWPRYSDEEMMELVAAGEEKGDIARGEREMIAGVIEFADKVAREVMIPRTDMVCVPAEATLEQVARLSQERGYSRLPVYEDNVDHIVGIVYAKDMVSALSLAPEGIPLTAGQLARKPVPVIPESKKVDDVLQLMQRKRLHIAIVIDEYGGTAGLVTIEDLLEEIFGEIRDEYDLEAEPIRTIEKTTFLVDGRVSVDEIEDELGVTLPQGEFDSVGGFILDQLGRLPVVGEKVVWQDMEFTVEAVSKNRIQRVRVAQRPKGDEHGEDSTEPT